MGKRSAFIISGIFKNSRTVLSAYADDITVFVNNTQYIKVLSDALTVYERASSEKSEALWVVKFFSEKLPQLSGNLKWRLEGFKISIYFDSNELKHLNWQGVEEKVCTRLSRWKWLPSQLSYRGRVLVANNLMASTL